MKELDAEALCRQLAEQIRPHVSPATALVGGEYRQGMAAVELVGEAPAARGELVLAAVEMGGDADHECDGMPLGDQPGDGGEPKDVIVTLGYAGWAAGQLEQELLDNAWLTVPADLEIVFELPPEERLVAAMQKLGIDFTNLSDVAGHA